MAENLERDKVFLNNIYIAQVKTYRKFLQSVVKRLDIQYNLLPNTSEYDKGLKFLNTLDNVLHETKQDALFGINTNAWIQEENFQRHAYNEAVLWINANSNYTFRFVTEAYGIME